MTPLLRQWLGALYRAQVLGEGSWDEAVRVVRGRLAADQGFRAEAERELARLRPLVRSRAAGGTAFIETKTAEYLEMLLSEKETAHG